MTTQLTSPPGDPNATDPSRPRRPGRSVLFVVGIVAAAAAALVAAMLMAVGAWALLGLAYLGSSAPTAFAAHDDAGAVAFTRSWVDTYQDSFRTGDSSLLEATSTPDCGECYAARLAIAVASGTTGLPAPITLTVTDASVVTSGPETATVHVEVRADGATADLGDGVTRASSVPLSNDVTLRWADGRWLVDSVRGDEWTPLFMS